MFQQRICQRERACGEEAGVPEASEAAADRERAHRILGVDLQSRLDSSLKQREGWRGSVCCVRKPWQIDRKSRFPLSVPLQRRCCWRRRMRLQRRSPRWTVHGTRGNKTFQVKTRLSACFTVVHHHRKLSTVHHFHLIIDFLQHQCAVHKSSVINVI